MEIDADLVRRVAQLSRLQLSTDEIQAYQKDLAQILEYVEKLKSIDVKGVEPLAHVGETSNVRRADEPRPSLSANEALRNAPESDGDYFLVPRILE